MQPRKHTKLGQLLVQQGMVQEWQFLQAMGARRPGQKLGEIMVERKFLSEEQLAEALAIQLDLQFVTLLGQKPDPACVKLVPAHVARRFTIFPVALRDAVDEFNLPTLVIAMADPTNQKVIEALRYLLNVEVEPVMAARADIEKAIRRTYGDDDPGSSDALAIPFPWSRSGHSGAMSMHFAA